jgi:hypothetical protein
MAIQNLNLSEGQESLYSGGQKINSNFNELESVKVDKVAGKSLVLDTEISKIHALNADNETVASIGALLNSATDKATPIDADTIGIRNSVGGLLHKLTWLNLKATLKTYFDTLYNSYTHPSGDGNKHVPANSTTNANKVLTAGATAGDYTWEAIPEVVTDHTLLSNIGTKTHAQLEAEIALNTAKVSNVAHPLVETAVPLGAVFTDTVYNDSDVLKDSDCLSAVTGVNKLITQDDIASLGGGDMLKSVYDTTNNGVVDNAEKVNGLTVQTAVPLGALFTDTIYDDAPVTSHIANTSNPHSVTKTQIGLENVDNIQQIPLSQKGAINGVAELNASGFVKNTQLPSYVDDVLEFANLASFPLTGESGKIYIALDTNKTYRWSGTVYVIISETITIGEVKADTEIASAISLKHAQGSDIQDLSGLELLSNKKTDVEANKTSNTFYASIKAVYDWAVAKFLPLTGGTINGNVIVSGTLSASNLSGTNTGDQDLSTYTNQGNTFNGVNQLVKTDGTGKLPAIDGSQLTNLPNTGGGPLLTTLISTNTPAVKGNLYVLTATLTLILPLNPTINDRVGVSNRSGTLTCVIARNGQNIQGLAEDMTIDALNIGFELVYTNATQGWVLQ